MNSENALIFSNLVRIENTLKSPYISRLYGPLRLLISYQHTRSTGPLPHAQVVF